MTMLNYEVLSIPLCATAQSDCLRQLSMEFMVLIFSHVLCGLFIDTNALFYSLPFL